MKTVHFSRRCFFLTALFFLTAGAAFALDIGLRIDQDASYESYDSENTLMYKGTLIPWVSALFGDGGRLYLSLGMTANYENKEWTFPPELLETELRLRFGDTRELRAGRLYYSDPLGFIAKGLFDGAVYSQDIGGAGRLSAGAWYTGFQYKKRAHITMTEEELDRYNEKFDYGNFSDTYFAPRRLLAAVDWEQWARSELIRLRVSLLGQFDLSGKIRLYHSQYLAVKAALPVKSFVFELGGCAELAENAQNYQVAFAGELGIAWMLPTPIHDRLSVTGRYSGGAVSKTISAFIPFTTDPQGFIVKAKPSGLSTVQLNYTARLHRSFSLQVWSTYFIVNDLVTYNGIPGGKDGYFLGNEFYGQVVFSPFSDLQIKAGGGAFVPSLGNARKDGPILWQVDLSVIMALF